MPRTPNDQIIIVPMPPLNEADRKIRSGIIGYALRGLDRQEDAGGHGGERERPDDQRRGPAPVASALALFTLTYALIEGGDRGWTSPLIVGAFALAAVAAGVFLAIESRSAYPMIPLRIFRSASFSGGIGTMMIWSFGVLGIYFFTSLYLQGNLGFSPTKAGLAFVPMALCLALAATLSPRVVPVLGANRTVALGMAVMTVGLLLFAGLGAGATFGSLLPGFILFGLGAGLMNVPLTNAVLDGVPTAQAGIASALFNASREVAGLLGVTVVGAVLRSSESAALRSGTRPAQAFIDGYHSGLWLTIGLLAVGVALSYFTLRQRRQAAGTGASAPRASAPPSSGWRSWCSESRSNRSATWPAARGRRPRRTTGARTARRCPARTADRSRAADGQPAELHRFARLAVGVRSRRQAPCRGPGAFAGDQFPRLR